MLYVILLIVIIFFIVALYKMTKTKTEAERDKISKNRAVNTEKESKHKRKVDEFFSIYAKGEDKFKENESLKHMFTTLCNDPSSPTLDELENAIKQMVSPPDNSIADMEKLEKLGELKEKGLITEEEFAARKEKLLENF